MSRQTVEVIEYSPEMIEISIMQVCRYLGMKNADIDVELENKIENSITEFKKVAQFRACYRIVDCCSTDEGTSLDLFFAPGKGLAKVLSGCNQAVIFSATTGLETERQRKRLEAISPSQALLVDAIGTTAIEDFCDKICLELEAKLPSKSLRLRFSPGYSDLPLSVQKSILESLDSTYHIGISLTDGLLMIPQKSVTAIVGIADYGCKESARGCQTCKKTNCDYRL